MICVLTRSTVADSGWGRYAIWIADNIESRQTSLCATLIHVDL